ncbi:hypothetical protein K461DRAFT_280820 [Myriangium duriaei CBS 260.36]|uniref:CENP-V/GFA domain-containing protein n=1 Tax=Myriangium duriaei CBS 260.36 TaxID=1168546 RepID=A0A9P4IVN6_9PEZI|nr:hypothetical protein K461DRAFT_280820 [Myriangium duriaei CBS 260.36]
MVPSNDPALSGSCACGAVTFTSKALPRNTQCCNCITCRKLSGAPFMAFSDFNIDDVEFSSQGTTIDTKSKTEASQGSFQTFRLSEIATRGACKSCHSPLTMVYHAHPNYLGITVGSIDEDSLKSDEARNSVRPQTHIFGEQQAGWYDINKDGIHIWSRFSPDFSAE